MKLQDHIDSTQLDMPEMQVKAFMLGALCAERPMPFEKAFEEIVAENPEAVDVLKAPMSEMWSYLKSNLKSELEKMFPADETDIHNFIEISKDQLDFFLTGMSLSGTNLDSCEDKDLCELIDELEDTVEDMDDFLADSTATAEDGEDFKEFLLDTWKDFVATK